MKPKPIKGKLLMGVDPAHDGAVAAFMGIGGKFVPMGHVVFDEAFETTGDGGKQWQGLQAVSKMSKTFSVTVDKVSPKTMALLTGLKLPDLKVPHVSLDGIAPPPTADQKKHVEEIEPLTGTQEDVTKKILADLKVPALIAPKPQPAELSMAPLLKAVKKLHENLAKVAITFNAQVQGFTDAMQGIADSLPPSPSAGRAHKLRRLIPGIDDVVTRPCSHGGTGTIWYVIQHLNDDHNPADHYSWADPWSRERIADWLETLDADLRVSDAPVLHPGDQVRGRISGAHGTVQALLDGEPVVRWSRSGLESLANARDLVLVEPEGLVWQPANQTFKPGDIVVNPAEELGKVLEVKQYYSLEYDTNVLELKVEWPNGIGTCPASAVQKLDQGDLDLPYDAGGALPPDIQPAPGSKFHQAVLDKLADKVPNKATLAAVYPELYGPLGLNDVVRLNDGSKDEGRVTQYEINHNNQDAVTFTVAWPDGAQTRHTRHELFLVEAYKPPTDDFVDWGSKKITAIHPNVY